ncbi:hypothetical protein FZEAL_3641 [Fusarium zealandicum]|uniref:Isopenicillin N synthase-like Fe(2+) 2OG dioxygenase domain-containing protein n=1 Tax=Fusarium zealandicum TaxID=1053134 RepID=A0A8H4UNU5_9HYPO|nr:hypothetical protein FZEAL_3641 [Fusarium zealandicum]
MAATSTFNASNIPLSTPSRDIQPAPLLDSSIRPMSSSSTIVSFEPDIQAPFDAIPRHFQDRGIFKTAATQNAASDQKFTIDLSPARNGRIPDNLRHALAAAGFDEVLDFFDKVNGAYIDPIMTTLSQLTGADIHQAHKTGNLNYRLCDYSTDTADPESDNGCGAHTNYGTFTIIFQDGTPGLEMEDAENPGAWVPVPGDAAVVLAGWCAVILSGGCIKATRHRVRRTPGVRRLSAILFVAPDLDSVINGEVNVGWFKEVMGKKWRRREGNEELEGDDPTTQDSEIENLIWA